MKTDLNNAIIKIKKDSQTIRKEARQRTIGYITAAFGLIAGLAWNDAVKTLIEYFFPNQSNSILIKFVYATGITLLVVVVSVYLTRVQGSLDNEEDKKDKRK